MLDLMFLDAHRLKAFISQSKQNLLIPILLNVTDQNQISDAVEIVTQRMALMSNDSNHLIGILNCTEISHKGPLEAVSTDDWLRVLHTNTVGPFSVISAFLPLLRASSGRIVNLSSFTAMVFARTHNT